MKRSDWHVYLDNGDRKKNTWYELAYKNSYPQQPGM